MNDAVKILSDHPVDPPMREQVLDVLRNIERQHDVRVLYACESGSRGWGFASPDSDYDVRFIYVQRLGRYLTVEPTRDVIEQPISGDLDVNGWDLRKALGLLRRSNPTLLEWLRSPIVYRQDEVAALELTRMAVQGFSLQKGYHHYVSMAKKNLREHLYGSTVRYKKYLYVIRPLLAARWMRQGRGAPPMRFADLAVATLDDSAVLDELNRLLAIKMRAGEASTSAPWPLLHDFIEHELSVAMAHNWPPEPERHHEEHDRFLHQSVLRYEEERQNDD